ncbi:MAG: sulfatase-like hydrolase/transferase [bacterium]|nr:sulfatase-like hydrolase/transferase [bacterium]
MRPNVLVLMTDQMQGRVLDPDHVCQTPNFDRLAARGVRFTRVHTSNAVCSPARASLMTGLLPHSHGVTQVTHCTFDDESVLRTDRPHWAQQLSEAGYRTGYFGKWHVERTDDLAPFGWQVNGERSNPLYQEHARSVRKGDGKSKLLWSKDISVPEGYVTQPLFGVTDQPVEERMLGMTCDLASQYLDDVMGAQEPWCCFVSVIEPHDPFIAHERFYKQYDPDTIPVPPNWNDSLQDRPGLYRKSARAFAGLSERDKKQAAACYYATVTEIDEQYGRLIDRLEEAGQLDNTIIVLTSDHGEFLGAHGMYTKNVGAYEEAYNIPLVVSGPSIAQGQTSDALVGIHDICPTLLELTGLDPFDIPDSRSFAPVLRDPDGGDAGFTSGYAEYYGTRYWLTQRVVWDGPWKFVWNGFDFDELYNLEEDPYEMTNLAEKPDHEEHLRHMMRVAWDYVRKTGDKPLEGSKYFSLRLAPFGPDA